MKEYLKPEVEVIDFVTENVTVDIGDGDIISSDVPRPGQG